MAHPLFVTDWLVDAPAAHTKPRTRYNRIFGLKPHAHYKASQAYLFK